MISTLINSDLFKTIQAYAFLNSTKNHFLLFKINISLSLRRRFSIQFLHSLPISTTISLTNRPPTHHPSPPHYLHHKHHAPSCQNPERQLHPRLIPRLQTISHPSKPVPYQPTASSLSFDKMFFDSVIRLFE
jgi:hypothetical protein